MLASEFLPTLTLDDPDLLCAFGVSLDRLGFTATEVSRRLGLEPSDLVARTALYALTHGMRCVEADDPLLFAAGLLWFNMPGRVDHYRRLASAEWVALADALGFIDVEGDTVRARVSAGEFQGVRYLSDHLFTGFHDTIALSTNERLAMPLHHSSLVTLEYASHFAGGDSILDIGCGCGATTLLLERRFAFPATGIDVEPRAVQFARATAALNNAPPDRFREGDIFTFDSDRFRYAVFNAPWKVEYWRDDFEPGALVEPLSRLVRASSRFLDEDARLVVLALVPLHKGENPELVLLRAVGPNLLRVIPLPDDRIGISSEEIAARRVRPDCSQLRNSGEAPALIDWLVSHEISSVQAAVVELTPGV